MSKILIAFLTGLSLGLLLAPENREELRAKLGDWLGDAADTARDKVKGGIRRGESAADNLEGRI